MHAAIGLVLTRGLDAKESVRRVARALAVGPAVPLDEAAKDVERAFAALRSEGVLPGVRANGGPGRPAGPTWGRRGADAGAGADGTASEGDVALRLEYPFAEASADGAKLVVGYVDLVASGADGALTVIDFKTDRAPTRSAREEYPAYVKQVRQYAAVLARGGEGRPATRAGLLFTETGRVEWCEEG
ncbi:MAG: PD-(D/E)XK nuclease family protein [Myxococcales bacterium]|nr:PD-(D/E)XK nuclease family protein [Myxococcales bacterium]